MVKTRSRLGNVLEEFTREIFSEFKSAANSIDVYGIPREKIRTVCMARFWIALSCWVWDRHIHPAMCAWLHCSGVRGWWTRCMYHWALGWLDLYHSLLDGVEGFLLPFFNFQLLLTYLGEEEVGCIAAVCEVVCYTEVRPGLSGKKMRWHFSEQRWEWSDGCVMLR